MGMFDNLPAAAGGDWQKQAAEAQAMADKAMKDAGYGDSADAVTMANAGAMAESMAADRDKIQANADEINRILTVGGAAKATIISKTDTGEKVAGNSMYQLKLSVVPEGGKAYEVTKIEMIPPQVLTGYADGTTMDARVDPADKNKVAFGDKPFK
ncbi:MAG TPA: hypothetical protein VGM38_04215 [Pseudolysinimonas sp.]